MKKIISIVACGLALAAVSCTKTDVRENCKNRMGVLSLNMNLADQTRAMTEDELRASAQVNIYKADFSGLVRSYKYSEMPSSISLAVDSYRVDVAAGEIVADSPAAASWENKSYKGSESFTITAGAVTNVQVKASVCNAMTNIAFDESVAANFNAGYSVTVGLDAADASTQLVYNAETAGKNGYFIIDGLDEPSFTWTFTGTLAKDGSSFTKTGTIDGILPGKLYKMNLKYTIKDGDLVLSLVVDYDTEIWDDTIVFEPVATGLSASPAYEIWAAHARVHADVDPAENEGKTVEFSYSANGSTWTTVAGINDAEGTWMADLTGLTPSTEYTYKLLIDGEEVGESKTFTTEAAPNVPNGSFEYASLVSGTSYYKFYDPDCGVAEGETMFWGSGNGEGSEGVNGSANMGIVITYVETSDKVDGNQSVLAATSQLAGFLAAGNIFTGQFAGLVGTEGGKVNFGRPWTSRPSALRLWCKYTTGKMDVVKDAPSGVNLVEGETFDRAQIKFALGKWSYREYGGTSISPVHINTTDPSTFVDFATDASTIAYGDLILYNDSYSINGEVTATAPTSWIQYTIPLEYSNLMETPTHIIISCAASQYGDYFSGSTSSKLWVDGVELIYE